MNKLLTTSLLATTVALGVEFVSTQTTFAATVISNIGIPAPADGSDAPLAGGTTTISAGGQEKAFGFTVPDGGNDWIFESAIFWLVGYDGTAANPDENPLVTITSGGANDGNNPVLGTLTANITDPIANPPNSNDPHYFEFSGDTPTLSAGETYYLTLSNDSASGFNWARSSFPGDTATSNNGFTSAGYLFRGAGTGGSFNTSSEFNGIAVNATELSSSTSVPEPSSLLSLGALLGIGALSRKRRK